MSGPLDHVNTDIVNEEENESEPRWLDSSLEHLSVSVADVSPCLAVWFYGWQSVHVLVSWSITVTGISQQLLTDCLEFMLF